MIPAASRAMPERQSTTVPKTSKVSALTPSRPGIIALSESS